MKKTNSQLLNRWFLLSSVDNLKNIKLADYQKGWALNILGYFTEHGLYDSQFIVYFDQRLEEIISDDEINRSDFITSLIMAERLPFDPKNVIEHLFVSEDQGVSCLFTALGQLFTLISNFSEDDITLLLGTNGAKFYSHTPKLEILRQILDAIALAEELLQELSLSYNYEIQELMSVTGNIMSQFLIGKKKQYVEAAKIKNEPNRKTKEYAIKLYEEGTWKSTRQASIKLIEPVMCYGEEVKRRFTDNYTAHKCIYDWLLKHVNSK